MKAEDFDSLDGIIRSKFLRARALTESNWTTSSLAEAARFVAEVRNDLTNRLEDAASRLHGSELEQETKMLARLYHRPSRLASDILDLVTDPANAPKINAELLPHAWSLHSKTPVPPDAKEQLAAELASFYSSFDDERALFWSPAASEMCEVLFTPGSEIQVPDGQAYVNFSTEGEAFDSDANALVVAVKDIYARDSQTGFSAFRMRIPGVLAYILLKNISIKEAAQMGSSTPERSTREDL